MAQEITFRIEDDAEALKLFEGIALKWKYQSEIGDPPVPNPETKKDFIARVTAEYWQSLSIQGYLEQDQETRRTEIEAIQIVRV